jgi:hypothetical protein
MGWNVKECTSTFVSFDKTTDVKKLSNIIRSLWIFKEKGGNFLKKSLKKIKIISKKI